MMQEKLKRYYSMILLLAACDSKPSTTSTEPVVREHVAPSPGQYRMQLLTGSGQLALDDFRGKIVLVEFFAAGSEEGRCSVAALNNLQALWRGRPFTAVGIAMDLKPQIYIASDLRSGMPTYPCAIGGKPARQVFPEVRALPTRWILDREGRVVRRYESAIALETVVTDLEDLLK